MAGGGGGEVKETSDLEYTPTWVVASVCSTIVFICIIVERLLHFLGKTLKKKNQKPLYEALQKIKEELMLLGFISLLLAVSQDRISKVCLPRGWTNHLLPCKKEKHNTDNSTTHYHVGFISGIGRRLLASATNADYCTKEGKDAFLSGEALHHLHIFIFVLAIVHVTFSVLTILIGGIKIRTWTHWEDSIAKDKCVTEKDKNIVIDVRQQSFAKKNYYGNGKYATLVGWLHSFHKQFYASVTKSDYRNLRRGFVENHCKADPEFDFHKYMVRCFEADFKKVVGISWYLWIFVFIFLLMNVDAGWHTYFWIAFIPLILLLAVGTKLQHVICQLAYEVVNSQHEIEKGNLVVKLSDDQKAEDDFVVKPSDDQKAEDDFVVKPSDDQKAEGDLVVKTSDDQKAEGDLVVKPSDDQKAKGGLVVKPSDDHFWFRRPRIALYLIHFILFQNAFEIAFFFWIWVQFGFDSCIMGKVRYVIPRLVIGAFIQVLCSYSTLPLYALVTRMGSSFTISKEVKEELENWLKRVKKRAALKEATKGSQTGSTHWSTLKNQMGRVGHQEPATEEGDCGRNELKRTQSLPISLP